MATNGRFQKGHPGGPGRPKGFVAVQREIMRRTGDGNTLVDFAEEVWADTARPWVERWAAFQWLSERGLGKPVNVTELSLEMANLEPQFNIQLLAQGSPTVFLALVALQKAVQAERALRSPEPALELPESTHSDDPDPDLDSTL